MTIALREMSCRPIVGRAAMSAQEWAPLTSQVNGWSVTAAVLSKHFDFKDFTHTMAFVNDVAAIAQVQDHHPEMVVSYGRCTVHWSTHSVNGLSINDFICAAQVDALVSALA